MLLLEKWIVGARQRLFGPQNAVIRRFGPLYAKSLDLLTLGRGIPRTLHDEETIRVSVTYRSIDERYEPGVYAFLKQCVRAGDVLLDIGAHVGIYTVLFARWVGPKGHVFAFEPCRSTAELLAKNIRLNKLQSRVTVVNSAMGAKAGCAPLYALGPNCENTLCPTASHLSRGFEAVTVPLDTVDRFCENHAIRPNVVKIDVEGYELHVLHGMTRTLPDHPHLLVEMHPFAWPRLGYDHHDFASFCRAESLEAVGLSGQARPLEEYGNVYLRLQNSPGKPGGKRRFPR